MDTRFLAFTILSALSAGIAGCNPKASVTAKTATSVKTVTTTDPSWPADFPLPAEILAARTNVSCRLMTETDPMTGQPGTCHRIITPGTGSPASLAMTKFIGTSQGVQPGHRICLRGGDYPYSRLWIEATVGTEAQPVEVINCEGRFVIGNAVDADSNGQVDNSRGIEFHGVSYLKLTGSGSKDHYYGIRIDGTSNGQSAVVFSDLSTDFEGEFIEVAQSGFAGFMAKTDGNCGDTDPNNFRGGFVQRNTVFHDNYIHDVEGEGFYIGNSFFQGRTSVSGCPGVPVFSHPLVGTKVYRNRLERIGCEAIQVGYSSLTEVYDNYIRGFGRSPFADYQNNGIQIGGGTSGRFFNNYVINPDPSFEVSAGITIIGYRDTWVYSNVVVNAGTGIYVNQAMGQGQDGQYGPYSLTLANNTIVNPIGVPGVGGGKGIHTFNTAIPIRILNNLILLGVPESSTSLSNHLLVNTIYDHKSGFTFWGSGLQGPNHTVSGNLRGHYAAEKSAYFVDPDQENFSLLASSAAVDAGIDVSSHGLSTSIKPDHPNFRTLNRPRIRGTAIDVGAYEADP
ncbi:MAG: right-handed parallel beta-helix repeat-containing protein [Bdellovibrionales bacterium]|nr:right-handed parallel beta-helix repeat-containing protein [Bdellovibrionales bacterium]